MGTPEFAVPSLAILVENGYEVVAVVTAPDKPAGRGQKLQTSPVKDYAVSKHIPVLQPTNLKSEAFIEELRALNANLQVVVAFRMLPEVVWDMPAIGTFNLHASLLPQYRGAAPINWAIINGEKETGATTFFLKHEIDTGDMIMQEREPIHPHDNVGMLYERLMHKGAGLVLRTVQSIEAGDYTTQPQQGELKHAPKIFKETCEIDFGKTTQQVYDFVRGLSPYPAAWTTLEGTTFKIFEAEPLAELPAPAAIERDGFATDNKHYFCFKTADGYLSVKEWQMQGKKRMGIEEFLRGKRFV